MNTPSNSIKYYNIPFFSEMEFNVSFHWETLSHTVKLYPKLNGHYSYPNSSFAGWSIKTNDAAMFLSAHSFFFAFRLFPTITLEQIGHKLHITCSLLQCNSDRLWQLGRHEKETKTEHRIACCRHNYWPDKNEQIYFYYSNKWLPCASQSCWLCVCVFSFKKKTLVVLLL